MNSAAGQRVIGYTYADERRKIVYFDPEFEKLATHSRVPYLTPPASISWDRRATATAPRPCVVGYQSGSIFTSFPRPQLILWWKSCRVRPELEGRTLPRSSRSAFPPPTARHSRLSDAAAGQQRKGSSRSRHAARRPQRSRRMGLRLAAAVPGGARLRRDPANYRGSDGYGDAWLHKNGFQGWRTAIGDVNDAAKYLVSRGIAKPDKLAIVGWSYGGYAALQSAVTEPTLYKAAIAIAPVTDFAMTKADAQDYTNAELVKRLIGSGRISPRDRHYRMPRESRCLCCFSTATWISTSISVRARP